MTYRRQERLFLFVRADRLSQRTRPRRSGPRPTLVFRSAPQATFTADARPCAADLCGPDGLPAGQADRRHRVAPRRWAHGQDQEGRLPVLIRVVEEELRLLLFLALRRFAGNVASRRNAIVDSAQTLPLQQAVILRAVAGSTCAPRRWPRPWLGRRGSCDCAQDDAFLRRRARGSHRAAPANRRRTLFLAEAVQATASPFVLLRPRESPVARWVGAGPESASRREAPSGAGKARRRSLGRGEPDHRSSTSRSPRAREQHGRN